VSASRPRREEWRGRPQSAKNGAADASDAELLRRRPLTGSGRNTDENGLGCFVHLFDYMKQAEVANPGQRLALCLKQLPHTV
jgi:hypothetical protein